MRRPRIAFCQSNIGEFLARRDSGFAGGAERQLVAVAEAASEWADVVVLTRRPRDGSKPRLGNGIEIIYDDWPDTKLPGLRNAIYYFATLGRAFWKARCDVYVQRTAVLDVFALRVLSWLRRKRFVYWWAHDLDAAGAGVHSSRPVAGLIRWGRRNADLQICQSNDQRRMLPEREQLRCRVIRNLPPTWRRKAADEGSVIWIGRIWSGFKRPERLLDAARRLPQRRFKVVGDSSGDDPFVAWFREQAKGLGNVELVGALGTDGVADQLAHARVAICTSDVEGFPNIFGEAAATGTPVVSWQVDPDGLLVSSGFGRVAGGQADVFAEHIEAMFDEPTHQAHRRGASSFLRSMSAEDGAKAFRAAIQGLLEGPGPSRSRRTPPESS